MEMERLTSRDMYEFYLEQGGDLDYSMFRDVISEFNIGAMDKIVYEGRTLEMGSNLSRLSVIRVDRNHASPRVNWPESNKLKQEIIDEGNEPMSDEHPDGEPWLIFYTDDWYCRFFWEKRNCKIKNHSAYRFDATRGTKGNKRKLIDLLKSDDLAYLMYDEAQS